ncbi:MAG TPA: PEP-CTERM sorting domain-containing protein [Pedomonas sp.]|uniref:PEP-CTERM sorting domain-containing protein n=1 Tax=Pedomonas sp. TaxID=2976421 RepID=UPI002F3FEC26
MRKMLMAVLACVTGSLSGGAAALPTAPFFATAEMVATVRSVSVGGSLMDRDGNYVRDLTLADTRMLPWNVGDRLTVRWEQHSDSLVDCTPDSTSFTFGGLTQPTAGGFSGPCYSPTAASFVELERARGGTSPVWDSWETMTGRGPVFNLETGEVVPYLDVVDGLVTDCCVYLYDPDADEVITVESNGAQNPEVPSWPVQFLWFTIFDGADGGGGMTLYSSQELGIFEWEDPDTGGTIFLGSLEEGYFGVSFDVEWRSTFQTEQTEVPEPASLALIGAGLLAASGLRRKRRCVSPI